MMSVGNALNFLVVLLSFLSVSSFILLTLNMHRKCGAASILDVPVIVDETGDRFISGEVVVMHLLLEMSLTCHPLLTVLSSKS